MSTENWKQHPCFDKKMASLIGISEKSGDIGVELEVEGFNLPTACPGWTVKQENSLRGRNGRQITADENLEDTPREYVTKTPVTPTALAKKLDNLSELLRAGHVKVNLTQRASTHVHVNFGVETLQTFLAFLLLYVSVEPLLLRVCGPTRNGNLFCVPTYEAGDMAGFVRRLSQSFFNKTISPWPTRGKYSSLNTDPMGGGNGLPALGSVEVRCFPNTVNPADVMKWVGWLLTLRDMARKSDPTFLRMLDTLYGNPAALIRSVFGEEDVYKAAGSQHPNDLVLYGITEAYEIWREMRPILDYKKVKVKVDKNLKDGWYQYSVGELSPAATTDMWSAPLAPAEPSVSLDEPF